MFQTLPESGFAARVNDTGLVVLQAPERLSLNFPAPFISVVSARLGKGDIVSSSYLLKAFIIVWDASQLALPLTRPCYYVSCKLLVFY